MLTMVPVLHLLLTTPNGGQKYGPLAGITGGIAMLGLLVFLVSAFRELLRKRDISAPAAESASLQLDASIHASQSPGMLAAAMTPMPWAAHWPAEAFFMAHESLSWSKVQADLAQQQAQPVPAGEVLEVEL